MIPEWRLQMMANLIFRKYLSQKEKLTILQYALSQYSCPKEGEDVPQSVIEAYFSKIVVKKDGFDWYIRINGDPNKPLHCKLEGKRRSTTKVVVTQDFSPALASSTTGCHQGLISNNKSAPRLRGGFCIDMAMQNKYNKNEEARRL